MRFIAWIDMTRCDDERAEEWQRARVVSVTNHISALPYIPTAASRVIFNPAHGASESLILSAASRDVR